ncbi:MAG: glycosyltransferase involved in cell wall biosynthesis [Cognaticolwellia sp.]|jgi:glycosyltransferase involved in cell wall biosynthesis
MLSLVLPLYNEEACVQDTVGGLLQALQGAGCELILVNNGSSDQTPFRINQLAIEHKKVKAFHLADNAGYGGGILFGLRQAQGSVVGWSWGDGQIAPEHVRSCLNLVRREGAQLAKVRRVERQDGQDRAMVSAVYSQVMRRGFGVETSDVNGCPKLMPRKVFEGLDLRSTDWFLDAETLLKAQAQQLQVREVQATMLPRSGGSSKVDWRTVLEFNRRLLAWKTGWRPE